MIRESPRRPGVPEILIPGEPEHRAALENRRRGIPLDPATLGELEALSREYGLRYPF